MALLTAAAGAGGSRFKLGSHAANTAPPRSWGRDSDRNGNGAEAQDDRPPYSGPEADVIVTNPTHISVAIKYDTLSFSAPIVVAKGVGPIAMRIREIAKENNIPLVEDKPLARTLNKIVQVGQVIPASLYKAVAEILAYVYKLKNSF